MPAQKLTRARFVQIIIMLTILIVAFFWRTLTHKNRVYFDCNLTTICTFKVNDDAYTLSNKPGNFEVMTDTNDPSITLTHNQEIIPKTEDGWLLSKELFKEGDNELVLNYTELDFVIRVNDQ